MVSTAPGRAFSDSGASPFLREIQTIKVTLEKDMAQWCLTYLEVCHHHHSQFEKMSPTLEKTLPYPPSHCPPNPFPSHT